jgi:hypothetical protein
MTIRNRSRIIQTASGGHFKALKLGVGDYDQGPLSGLETCTDVNDSSGGDNPLFIKKLASHSGVVNGKIGSAYEATNVLHTWDFSTHGYPIGWPSDAVAQTAVLSRANPSKPVLDVVQFLGELKDVPHMVLQLGNFLKWLNRPRNTRFVDSKGMGLMTDQQWSQHFGSVPRWAGEIYLNWKFGFEPLISDLLKLFDFTEAVDRRIEELNGIFSGKGLRKKVKVAEHMLTWDLNDQYVSDAYQTTCKVNLKITETFEKWGTVTYSPTQATPHLFGSEQRDLARSLVFGQNLSISTIWELLPWTWLIDWFSNTGDFLSATRNTLGLSASNVCIMEHFTRKAEFNGFSRNDFGATYKANPSDLLDTKSRVVMGSLPQLGLRLGFLSLDQMSILSSLQVSKFRHLAR